METKYYLITELFSLLYIAFNENSLILIRNNTSAYKYSLDIRSYSIYDSSYENYKNLALSIGKKISPEEFYSIINNSLNQLQNYLNK